MRTRGVIDDEFDYRKDLCPIGGLSLKNVLNQHAQDLLNLLMDSLHSGLLVGPPRRTEPVAQPYQSYELRHQGIFKLRASI